MHGEQRKRNQEAMKQTRAVQAILRRWDPIGVEPGQVAPADEYDSYAPHIVSMVAHGCSIEQLSSHLERLRTETMGVGPNPQRDDDVADEILVALCGE